MKIKLSAMLLLLVICSAYAQTKNSVSGILVDASTNENVPYATVAIKQNDKVITGVMSQDDGSFKIDVASGKYIIEIEFIGYKNWQSEIDLTSSSVALGTIQFETDVNLMDEVNIVAEQSTVVQKIDRKVITVGKDLSTVGATASEIMNNIPSVNVDQDGAISLRGNQNVRILVDGRPTNIAADQLLKQIPSSSIKSIELITNPSAKYNPEGMSGIINIVLHKNSNDGFNGSASTGFTIGESVKNNNTLDLNFRKNKLNVFGTASTSNGRYVNDGEIKRLDQNSTQLIDVVSKNNNLLYKVGLDYYINDKNTISGYTNQSNNHGPSYVDTSILYPDGNFSDILQQSHYGSKNRNSSYNLAYKHLINDKGHNLDIEINYNDNKSTSNGDYLNKIANQADYTYTDYTLNTANLTTVNVDYVNPFNDKSKLEIGAEARVSGSKSKSLSDGNPLIPTDQRDINYNYDYEIYSAYVTFGQKFDKLSYQIGTRIESYQVESKLGGNKDFSDDYLTLYPSVFLGYDLSDNDMFQLSYSRRVDRPGIWQTRPIREFSTPTITSVGNPKLRPQFTNSIELNYTRMLGTKGSLTAGIYYRRVNDEINRVIYKDTENSDPNAMIMTYDNFDSNNSFGFEVSANLKLTSWFDIQPAIDFSSLQQKGLVSTIDPTTSTMTFITREITANALNARLNANFKATNALRFNLFGFYRSAVDGLSMNSKDMHKIDAGARYSLLNNKLSLSLRVSDIFNTMKARFTGDYPYAQAGEFSWESRTAYLGASFTFGGSKARAMTRKARTQESQGGSQGGIF